MTLNKIIDFTADEIPSPGNTAGNATLPSGEAMAADRTKETKAANQEIGAPGSRVKLKCGWQIKSLVDVCTMDKSQGIHKSLPYIGLEHIESQTGRFIGSIDPVEVRSSTFKFTSEHVLYGRLRPYLNKVMLPDFSGHCSTEIFPLKPCSELLRKFLQYWFLRDITVEQINATSTGARMPRANMNEVMAFEFLLPPLPDQRRIVGILDEAFEAIATAKAAAEKNLQNARALFESHLNDVFTRRGEGWKMEKLDNLTELARGQNPPKSKFSYTQKPGYVRFYQIRDGSTDDYTVYVPDTPQLHKMKKDDIMMVAYRHVGRVFRGVEGAFNVALCKISNARKDLLEDDFLFHLIPSIYVKGELLKRSERSLIPSMSIEHLREIKVPLPPIQEQRNIIETINRLSEETQRLESLYQRKLDALEELKRSLLNKAFSGEM